MKTNTKLMLTLLALGASAFVASAQDNNDASNDGGQQGPGMRPHRHRPPPPAVILALDANHDGVIDSNEIANASAELKTLDKNGDGKLTPDEFIGRPPHRPHQGGNGDASRPDDNGAGGPPDNGPQGPPPDQQ
jgi:EF hand